VTDAADSDAFSAKTRDGWRQDCTTVAGNAKIRSAASHWTLHALQCTARTCVPRMTHEPQKAPLCMTRRGAVSTEKISLKHRPDSIFLV